jgi:hypothetical protein
VTDPLPNKVLLTLSPAAASDLEQALSGTGVSVERAGSQRGLNQAVELIIVATPSIAALALLLEKIRRLRLPRTYVRVKDETIEWWTDPSHNDGRTFAVSKDGDLTELPDTGLSVEAVQSLFRAPGS